MSALRGAARCVLSAEYLGKILGKISWFPCLVGTPCVSVSVSPLDLVKCHVLTSSGHRKIPVSA